MKAYHLSIAAAAAGLVLAASTPVTAAPLAPASPGPLGLERFDGQVEPVHYRRRAYRRPYGGPVISFGVSPYAYASPYYYAQPYGYGYPYRYGYGAYPYGYGYGYAPSFSFGFGIR